MSRDGKRGTGKTNSRRGRRVRSKYLHDRAYREETQVILADKELMKDLEEAQENWNNGENYVDWEDAKEEV